MGWNDHVSFNETECLSCGAIDTWEYWDEVAVARYSGTLGEKLGHDVNQSGNAPTGGSTNGTIVEDEDDGFWEAMAKDD